ncbi:MULTISPECIES: hypothetical protein, partial [unclassified Vibrio]|uniref:hypothetical protein n=1 Tax=unclassified Vibrio TaxID=2614977 RepID=UPI0019CF71A5
LSTPAISKPQQKCWGFFISVASTKQCCEQNRQPGQISGVPAQSTPAIFKAPSEMLEPFCFLFVRFFLSTIPIFNRT